MGTTAPIEYRAVGDVDSPRTAAGGLVDHRGDLSTAAEPARSAALVGATTLAIYLAAVDRVANDVMSAAAVALGMHADHFERYLDKDPTVMRANNYQRRAGAPDPQPNQMGMGAHTDYGSITVLLADPVPGSRSAMTLGVGATWLHHPVRSS